jgi:hypothetical protein
LTDFADAMANAYDGGLPARVKKTAAVLIDYPAAFTSDGNGIVFAKISGE